MPLLELRDIRKCYHLGGEEIHALDGVTMDIEVGEFISIIGPSGSGKSTLMHILGCLDSPTSGALKLDGTMIHNAGARELAAIRNRKIGFVFQFFNLLPTLTALENLLLPLELANGIGGDDAEAKARDLLDAVRLGDRAGTFPDRLSGGEQQRIAIARALIHGPELLLADEPTGNLDQDTGELVVGLLDELVSAAGTTMVVVTHALTLAERMDRILRVDHGQLVEA